MLEVIAFGKEFGFHVLVVPPGLATGLPEYVNEEQAADYPEGRYELNLQIAAEAGDQRELDALFARRSRAEILRLGVLILVGVVALVALIQWLPIGPPVAAVRRSSVFICSGV